MALGDYAAGEGPCGFDPRVTTDRTAPVVPKAILIDLVTRRTLFDSNGYARAMDPVDQEVALSIGIEKGAITSAPNTGLDVQRILRASDAALLTTATDAVNVAVARPLARGDIRILAVNVERREGRVLILCDYYNVRTAKPVRAETT